MVLLLPIGIYYLKGKQIKQGLKYLLVVATTWLAFNLPVMIVSFDGWKYFYTFSFNRGLGDGSIYSVLGKLGIGQVYSNALYYALNIALFGTFIFLTIKSKQNLSLAQTAFFAMFCFTYFGKQYSMQYVLWLAPLAVITIASLPKRYLMPATYLYGSWQGLEILFRATYFQNWNTNVSSSRGLSVANPISDNFFGAFAIARYLLFIACTIVIANGIFRSKE